MSKIIVRHDDKDSLSIFAAALRKLDRRSAAAVCSRCLLDGHLFIQDPEAGDASIPEIMEALGVTKMEWMDATMELLLRVDGALDSVLSMLVSHMCDGHDEYDFQSAGGYDLSALRDIAAAASLYAGLDVEVEDRPESRTGIHAGNQKPVLFEMGRMKKSKGGSWKLVRTEEKPMARSGSH